MATTWTVADAAANANSEVDADIVTTSLDLENYVTATDKYVPLTGVHATEESIGGWEWDKRKLENLSEDSTRHATAIGGHYTGLTDGTVPADWQSGTTSGIGFYDTDFKPKSGRLTWTPRVKTGSYTTYAKERPLYSDYSVSANVDPADTVSGVMQITLESDAVYESLFSAIYTRDSKLVIQPHQIFEQVAEFTGELNIATGVRATTRTGGVFIPANFSPYSYECIVEDGVCYFNGEPTISVGDPRVGLQAVVGTWEDKGHGTDGGRVMLGNHFPWAPTTARLVSIADDGTLTEWTEVDDFGSSLPTDQHFVADYDLGTITMGGYTVDEPLYLETMIDPVATELTVLADPDLVALFPYSGVIQIGSEKIQYGSREGNVFGILDRAFDATIPGIHFAESAITLLQSGAFTTDPVFISYDAVPRVDYEVTDYDIRTANRGHWVDVSPTANVETNNVLQLLSQNINLDTIVLESNSDLIGGNLYGPVFYGTDVSRIVATAYDVNGNRVDDMPLEIRLVAGDGNLNGDDATYSALTNTKGQISAYYNPPYGVDQIDTEVTSVQHVGADTVMTLTDISSSAQLSEITVFQVLKHDAVFGTVGHRSDIKLHGVQSGPGTAVYRFQVEGLYDTDKFEDGVISILGTDTVKYSFNIVHVEIFTESTGQANTRFYVDTAPGTPSLLDNQPCWLLEQGAIAWDPATKKGVNVLLYEYSTDFEHPITGSPGAYGPVRADSFANNQLTFTGRNLPIPAPEDDDNNLGAYIVTAPTEVTLRAYGVDPFSGRQIVSNDIRIYVKLPVWLEGVDTSGALPVPVGFTFVTESYNIGAGVGLANFITINPAAAGINQFGLTGLIP